VNTSSAMEAPVEALVHRVLPSVCDAVRGHEAGCWQGVDHLTGSGVTIQPVSTAPFAGVVFQTTYI